MWYNSPFNKNRRMLPYIDGSRAANTFFNVKAGSWVLKRNAQGPISCKLCGNPDSEIHRLFQCSALEDKRRILSRFVYLKYVHSI